MEDYYWQPMSTAPKDGSTILIYAFDLDDILGEFGEIIMVYWDKEQGGWVETSHIRSKDEPLDFAYWFPMPIAT